MPRTWNQKSWPTTSAASTADSSKHGGTLEDIVEVTIYLMDPRYREAVYRTVSRWLTGVYPVSTGLVVSALARPEWLVEIDVIAVRQNAASGP
jgi:enamine deaminase RidA (YjgF/YER057c/UK114 family)